MTEQESITAPDIASPTTPLEATEFRLSPEQWQAFCDRLEEPARIIPALRDLFGEPEPTE